MYKVIVIDLDTGKDLFHGVVKAFDAGIVCDDGKARTLAAADASAAEIASSILAAEEGAKELLSADKEIRLAYRLVQLCQTRGSD